MNLVKWENRKIVISPEAYYIKVFRDIWDMDKDKTVPLQVFGLLYFQHDPRSEFMFVVDDDERLSKVREALGIKEWDKLPDQYYNAIKTYEYLTNTSGAMILADNRSIIEKTRRYLNTINYDDKDRRGDPKWKLSDVLKNIRELNKTAVEITEAEKEIHKDVEEHSATMRGKGTKKLLDDGLNFMNDDNRDE